MRDLRLKIAQAPEVEAHVFGIQHRAPADPACAFHSLYAASIAFLTFTTIHDFEQ